MFIAGDHMTPMSDDAVTKQNKLRKLRHEMIQVRRQNIIEYLILCMVLKIADEAQNLRAGVQRHPSKQGECSATSE